MARGSSKNTGEWDRFPGTADGRAAPVHQARRASQARFPTPASTAGRTLAILSRMTLAVAVLGPITQAHSAPQAAGEDSVAVAPRTPVRIEDIDASHGMPLYPKLPLYLHVQPRLPPPPEFTADDERDVVASLADPQSGGDDEFRPEAPETSVELALSPRVWVHPRVPQEVLRKNRIDDSVVLQCLIDVTGRVQRVRVLRGIPNCPECTKSARVAAQQFVYNAPPRQPHIRETWTTPFEIHFTAGRRARLRR